LPDSPFVWSADVQAEVGEGLLASLANRLGGSVICEVCNRPIDLAGAERAAVSVARPANQLLFTHPSCMASRVLSGSGNSPADIEAHGFAFVLMDELASSHAYLAFEAAAHVVELPRGSGDVIDLVLSRFLGAGLALVTDPFGDACFPAIPGWRFAVDDQQIEVVDEAGQLVYSAPRGAIPDQWIQQAYTNEACRILSGSGIGLVDGDFAGKVDAAIADGRVVGGTIVLSSPKRRTLSTSPGTHDVSS
jgi:hypothetical protein